MIEGLEEGAALLEGANAVQPNGVEPFEDIAVLAVLRRAAMLLDETLDLFEARDDPLFSRRSAGRLVRRCEVGELACQFVEVDVSHTGLLS